MRSRLDFMYVLLSLGIAHAQSGAIVTNLDTPHWTVEKGAPADTASVMIRADQATGGMDLLVRFPGGHIIAPHYHESNERIVVVEGRLTLHQDGGDKHIETGGFAFLPAREVQRLSCTSKTRCTFYLSWDGKPDSHPAK